jgi:thymidylate synthase (FAD)
METRRLVIPAAEEVIDAYFPVLDHGFVALKDYMGGDISIEEMARNSYGKGTRKSSDTRKLLRYLFRKRHTSPFERCELVFHLGLPIFVMRQLIRHRTASLNEYSGRYSVMPLLFYTPQRDQVCHQSAINKQGRAEPVGTTTFAEIMDDLQASRLVDRNFYEEMLEHDVARETARIELPLSTYTYCYWKMDLKNLLHLIGLRADSHAQWEIRQYADVMAGLVQRVAPLTLDAFQDYQMNAVTFCQAEMAALRTLAHFHASPIAWENPHPDVKRDVNQVLADYGIESREAAEFWEKIRPQHKSNFALDMGRALPASHFEAIIKEASYE